MEKESASGDVQTTNETSAVKRRGLLKLGTLLTGAVGAVAVSTITPDGANAVEGATTAYIPVTEKGAASGVATLDAGAKLASAQLPDLSGPIVERIKMGRQYVSANDNTVANIKADGVSDDVWAWNALRDAVTGKDVVLTWKGNSVLSTCINWKSGLSLIGSSREASKLIPTGGTAIQWGGSLDNPITNCLFADFSVDGSRMPGPTGKAIFMTYLKRPIFRNLHIYDTASTGLGCDFMLDGVFDRVIVERCGRTQTVDSPGSSGIGIGTGAWENETYLITNCITRDNKRNGIFLEKQSFVPYYAKFVEVIGCVSTGNLYGLGDQGVQNMKVIGGSFNENVRDGINLSTSNGSARGLGTDLVDLDAIGNGRHGINIEFSTSEWNGPVPFHGRYRIRGSRIARNSVGIKGSLTNDLPNLVVTDNDVFENSAMGLHVAGSSLIDPVISRNRFRSNGKAGASPAVMLLTNLVRGEVRDNIGWDDAAGLKTQTNTVEFTTGQTVTDTVISGNVGQANRDGNLLFSGTLAGRTVVRNNPGYGPAAVDGIAVTASPQTYTAGPRPEEISIIGGTVSNVSINGQTWLTGSGQIHLEPGDVMKLTYSAIPVVKRRLI